MKKEYLYGIIGLLGGVVLAVVFANNAVNSNNQQMMRMMGMYTQNIAEQSKNEGMTQMHEQMMEDDEMTMSGMVNELQGKTGDDFDKAFVSEMIEHHQGAIDMAKLAQQYAKHDEIKNLADDIISAQTNEIEMMRKWQKTWGY